MPGGSLIFFLRDDLLILLSMWICCMVLMRRADKRPQYPLRLALCTIAMFLYDLIIMDVVIGRFATGQPVMALSILKYGGIYFLLAGAILVCYKTRFFRALFGATVSYSLQNMVERLFEIIRDMNPQMPTVVDRLLLSVCFAVAIYLLARLSRYILADSDAAFNTLDSRIMLLVAAMTLGINVVVDLLMRRPMHEAGLLVKNCMHVLSASVSLMSIIISMSHLHETEAKRRAEIATTLLRADQKRFELDKAMYDAINVKCHDIRHQIAALGENGYENGLKEVGKLVNIYDASMRTKNHALDIVLSGKQLACADKKITFTCMADGQKLDFMADSDIYALFGNILDNAIEAVTPLEDEEKRLVTLRIYSHESFVLIEEENYFSGIVQFQDGLPLTSKADKMYHGFGIHSIQMLVKKYGGTVHIDTDKDIFSLSIMLPLP